MSSQPNDGESASPSSADCDATRRYRHPSEADTAAPVPIPPPTPPVLPSMPGYEILGELARGGMGVVYKAKQLGFNRIVALKMILSGSHAGIEERERFRIEAEAVARLQHPNIVQVHEVGEHEGKPFYSMEFCPGGGLDQMLHAGPLPPVEAARLVEALARAVQAAHEKGVVHRDLKPANVLLAEDAAPKVADFGLSKRLDAAGRTQSGAVMGTPNYMSPEQAAGKSKEVGPATDVYALGAILYECLTGRPPFQGPSSLETLTKVISVDPVPPRRLQPKTPRDLEAVVMRCLEKTPTRRYASADELAQDLLRFLDGKSVAARPVGAMRRVLRRTGRSVRRHPGVVLGVSAAVVLGLLAGVLSPRLWPTPTPATIVKPTPAPDPPSPPPPAPLPRDLALVPPDAAGFISVRLADLAAAPQFAELRRRLAKTDPRADQLLDTAFSAVPFFLSLDPADVDRATVVFLEMPRSDALYQSYLVIVSTKKVYDPARRPLLPELFKTLGAFSIHPLSEHLLLIGPSEKALREFSRRPPTAQPQGPLASALHVAALPEFHAVVGLNLPPAFLKTFGEKMPPEIRKDVLPVTETRTASIALTLAAPPPEAADLLDLQIDARLTFADADAAKRGADAVVTGLNLIQAQLTQLSERLAKGDMKPEDLARQFGWASPLGFASLQFLNPAVYALVKAKTETQGDTVHVLLNVRTDAPVLDVNGFRFDPAWIKDAINRTKGSAGASP